ncbi:hypothetical protein [Proteiniborus sp.]|uniref:hypothetical protein n=1 Tax=Proteiniborus sp. TaxID=2079015 RepID=UPI003321E34D
MKYIINKHENKLVKLEDEEYILYRIPKDKLCGTCNETISEILRNDKSGYKVLIEFYEPEEKNQCPAIKQININKLLY